MAKSSLPKLEVPLTNLDRGVETLSVLSLIGLWAYTLLSYADLPDSVPMHFNGAGEVDRYGAKISIFVLPVIALVFYGGLTVLNKYPHYFNYPTTVTAENALEHYQKGTRFIRILKLACLLVFALIVWRTILLANNQQDGLGGWFLPIILALTLGPVLVYVVVASKRKAA